MDIPKRAKAFLEELQRCGFLTNLSDKAENEVLVMVQALIEDVREVATADYYKPIDLGCPGDA